MKILTTSLLFLSLAGAASRASRRLPSATRSPPRTTEDASTETIWLKGVAKK